MTNEEAIKWLKDIHHRFNPTGEKLENEGGDVHLQALDMAIEALKQVTGKLRNPDDSLLTEDAEACKEQKSKLDLISRQDAINAVKSKWYVYENKHLNDYEQGWNDACDYIEEDILDLLPSAEPKVECIAQIKIDRDDIEDMVNEKVNEIVDKMAEPKTGKWIYVDNESVSELWSCSGCGQWSFGRTNYCPNCGADMRGEGSE